MPLFNNYIFISALILLLVSITLHYFGKYRLSVAVLFIGALFIRYFVAHLDPFLHDWDEKFHALVARNLMDHPFRPMLRKREAPMCDINYKVWCCNNIWLHKQPLFMWQMALSMKLFGISEYAIRYPSVLMGALTVPVIYRITFLMSGDRLLSFAAALFMCLSQYQLDLISGYSGMDHNDVAFGFYVLLSIWAYAEYVKNEKSRWWIMVGIFAGCAVLNKWLTGLLVFAPWGIYLLLSLKGTGKKEWLHFVLSLMICVLIFLPWQIYILQKYPVEAHYEYAYNTLHLFEVVEGHDGDGSFYLNNFSSYFGHYVNWLVPVGILLIVVNKKYNKRIKWAIALCFVIVFAFFSFVVSTKMTSYMYIVIPLGFILMAMPVVNFLARLRANLLVSLIAIAAIGYFVLAPQQLEENHNPNDEFRKAKVKNAEIYKTLREYLPGHVKIVANLPKFGDVEMMFYHNDVIAYSGYPSQESMDILEAKKISVAAFDNYRDYCIPDYVRWYTYRYILHKDFGYIYFSK